MVMTRSIGGMHPAAAASGQKQSRQPKQELDKESFLQLLVTQLRYQNPMEPMDNREFLAQLAQFNALEQMQSMNKTLESVATGQKPLEAVQATLEKILAVQEQLLARFPAGANQTA